MKEETTTLAVSKTVADKVRAEAATTKLSLYEYVNLALLGFIELANVKIDVSRKPEPPPNIDCCEGSIPKQHKGEV